MLGDLPSASPSVLEPGRSPDEFDTPWYWGSVRLRVRVLRWARTSCPPTHSKLSLVYPFVREVSCLLQDSFPGGSYHVYCGFVPFDFGGNNLVFGKSFVDVVCPSCYLVLVVILLLALSLLSTQIRCADSVIRIFSSLIALLSDRRSWFSSFPGFGGGVIVVMLPQPSMVPSVISGHRCTEQLNVYVMRVAD